MITPLTLALTEAVEPALAPIVQPYLLVLFSVPFHVDSSGRRWIDRLWAKDLIEHTRYIKDLTLVSRAVHTPAPPHAVAMDEVAALREVRCVELPAVTSLRSMLASVPRVCALLWRELGRARIVHTSVAGWPLPEAWFLVPLRRLRRRWLYINVESAFWRLAPGAVVPFGTRLRARIFEVMNRACVGSSDLSTFTHAGYLRSLLRRGTARGHVVEASWVDHGSLISADELRGVVQNHRSAPDRLRLVYAGRINREKGIVLLIEALAACRSDGLDVELDVFGHGPLMDECLAMVERLGIGNAVRFRDSLPYDQLFLEALRGFDAMVVPSTTDEQPRIVFDAYSQGLPVIASRTDGLRQCVQDEVTGLMFEAGDVQGLRAVIHRAIAEHRRFSDMSVACLELATRSTHQMMHRRRWQLLIDAFPALTQSDPTDSSAPPLPRIAENLRST